MGNELEVDVPEVEEAGAVVAVAGGSNFDANPADPMLVIIWFQIPIIVFKLCKMLHLLCLLFLLLHTQDTQDTVRTDRHNQEKMERREKREKWATDSGDAGGAPREMERSPIFFLRPTTVSSQPLTALALHLSLSFLSRTTPLHTCANGHEDRRTMVNQATRYCQTYCVPLKQTLFIAT